MTIVPIPVTPKQKFVAVLDALDPQERAALFEAMDEARFVSP